MPFNHAPIKKLREKRGLTQAAAASIAGMRQSEWGSIERGGRTNPSIRTAEAVAGVLGVPVGRLICRVVTDTDTADSTASSDPRTHSPQAI